MTQAIGQRFHHMDCKIRMLLNQELESPLVDWGQSTGSFCHYVGGALAVINQRHLTDERPDSGGLEEKITQTDVDLPLQDDVHFIPLVALPKKEITGRQLYRIHFVTKKLG